VYGNVAAPGLPGEKRPVQLEDANEALQVRGDVFKAIASFRLVAEAVPALINRDDSMARVV
jgi:hypothetical protein